MTLIEYHTTLFSRKKLRKSQNIPTFLHKVDFYKDMKQVLFPFWEQREKICVFPKNPRLKNKSTKSKKKK